MVVDQRLHSAIDSFITLVTGTDPPEQMEASKSHTAVGSAGSRAVARAVKRTVQRVGAQGRSPGDERARSDPRLGDAYAATDTSSAAMLSAADSGDRSPRRDPLGVGRSRMLSAALGGSARGLHVAWGTVTNPFSTTPHALLRENRAGVRAP